MYQSEKVAVQTRKLEKQREKALEINIDKALAELERNVSWYRNTGLTHISSLLN